MQTTSLETSPVNYRGGQSSHLLLAKGRFGSQQLAITWVDCPPGSEQPAHEHDGMEQVYVIVLGSGTMTVGDDRREVLAGTLSVRPTRNAPLNSAQRRPRDARVRLGDRSALRAAGVGRRVFVLASRAPDLGREPREGRRQVRGRAQGRAPDRALGRHRPVEHAHPARRHRVTRAGPRHGLVVATTSNSRPRRHRRGFLRPSYGQPMPGTWTSAASTWPVRPPLMLSGPRHSLTVMNSVRRSGAAEHAGEAAAVELDRLQHLAAFADAHAALVRDVGVPDGALGVEADAVREPSPRSAQTRRFDRPPSAAMSNAVSRVAVGLGDDQRGVVGRDRHAVGEGDAVGHRARRAVGGDQGDDARARTRRRPGSRSRCC